MPAPPEPEPSTLPLFHGASDPLAVQAVEDPDRASVPTVDCVSCHTSTSRTIALGLDAAARLPAPKGITAVVRRDNLQGSIASVRNFGYFGARPSVSMRTLNETAAVAHSLDTWVLESAGPSKVVVDDALWTRCMNGGGPGCDDTICRTPEPVRSPDSRVGACRGDVADAVEVSDDGRSVTVHRGHARCLASSMNGSFFSDALDVTCLDPERCTIVRKRSSPITGGTAARLRGVLGGPRYEAASAAHSVTLACADDCNVSMR